ncbi:MAG: hypothetical protein R3218_05590 [Christiangramia sp.]|nr:hypothetical protein [Christiangramia sp.]
MKQSRIFILASIPMLILSLWALIYNMAWLSISAELSVYFILFAGFFKKLDFKNLNVILFLGFSVIAEILSFFKGTSYIGLTVMFFQMASYIFLTREAHRYTERENPNRFMQLFFLLMIGANFYFVYGHFQELQSKMGGFMEFGFYSLYYLNLLVLAVVGLIYYLNSYSRKSVFFISLVMAIVVSDILRDMSVFYLPDTSVLLLKSFLQLSGIILAFLFYSTKERKLKLINLV